ncbi:MAG: hypothetical protein ACO1Q7_06950 [Gemmatimonas sp.]
MFLTHKRSLLAISLAMVSVSACKKGDEAESSSQNPPAEAPVPTPPPAATALTIYSGRRLGDNKQVSDSTSTFGVRDTMYVVVTTDNTPTGGNMMAKWTYETGQTVDSIMQQVEKTTAEKPTAVTEFHVSKANPWPAGKYTVDITLDGRSLGTKVLEVKAK